MSAEAQTIGTLAAKIVEPWAWWRAALANPSEIGKSLSIHDGAPEQGYYRTRFKGQPWEPVAIWCEDNKWFAYRNGREVQADEIWTFACKNPVTYEAYQAAIEGKGWADEPTEAKAIVGHNSGDLDPFEALRSEYLGEQELANEFLSQPADTQAKVDKLAIWSKRLTAIKTKAEAQHKIEKQPHLDAGRAVDDKWRDLKTEPEELAKRLKAHCQPFMVAQKRAEEERARKAAEEAAALRRQAEAEYRAAQDAINKATDADIERAHRDNLLRVQEAERAAEVQNASAGRTGAKVSIRVENVGYVTDYAKAAAALVAMKHPDMLAEIERLAKAAGRKNFPFDGMEIREEERVI